MISFDTWIYLVLAVALWGIGGFFDKLSLMHSEATAAFVVRECLMAAIFVPMLIAHCINPVKVPFTSSRAALLYISLSVFVTTVGMFFYLKAMGGGAQASKIVPLSSTYPLITVLLAALFIGEKLTMDKLAGTLLIAGGVWFISR
jgi:transporter family protein